MANAVSHYRVMTPDRAETCLRRLAAVSINSGIWGKTLSCILAGGWGFNILLGDQIILQWPGFHLLALAFSPRALGIWFMLMAIVPMIGVATEWLLISVLSSACCMATWIWLLAEAVHVESTGRPAIWTCLVGVLAFANAETQLAKKVFERMGHGG